jgi:hypothetical protein
MFRVTKPKLSQHQTNTFQPMRRILAKIIIFTVALTTALNTFAFETTKCVQGAYCAKCLMQILHLTIYNIYLQQPAFALLQ